MKDIQQDTMGKSLVPPLYIIINFFFHSLSATVTELLLNEKRYEPAVFAKISQIYPFVTLCGPILSIIYRFSLKWFCLKVIDMFSVTWICDFLRNYHVLRFGGYWQNGLRYEKSDAIFRILGKFPFRYITLLFFLSLSRMFKIRSKMWQKSRFSAPVLSHLYIY